MDRLPPIQVVACNFPVQVSHNLAIVYGVVNGSTGKVLGFEVYDNTKFESIYIDGCLMMIASDLPRVVHVNIPSSSIDKRMSIIPATYPNTTFPMIPVTTNADILLTNRHCRVKITQIPYSVAFPVTTTRIQCLTTRAIFVRKLKGMVPSQPRYMLLYLALSH